MPANDRPPSSQWYWRDWLTDPAVQRMSFDERGRYMQVLGMTHQTDEPGVCSEEDIRIWAGYSEAEWSEHRAAFERVFKIRHDGKWVQKRTVQEREAQRKRREQSQRGGLRSATRARDSLGRLEPRLDDRLEPRLGTLSSSSSSSPSMRSNPTQPLPAVAPSSPSAQPESFEVGREIGRGADRENRGPVSAGELVPKTVARLREGSEPDSTGFPYSLLNRLRARYPGLDVFAIAAQVREDVNAGGVRSPRGLLVARCRKAHDEVAEHRSAATARDSSPQSGALDTRGSEAPASTPGRT
jgi:uncharacterized protein YdaU (DUF1376 family)